MHPLSVALVATMVGVLNVDLLASLLARRHDDELTHLVTHITWSNITAGGKCLYWWW